MKRIKTILIFSLTLLLSCNHQTEFSTRREKKVFVQTECLPYFQYDKVEHYFINISEDSALNFSAEYGEEDTRSEKEKNLDTIILQYELLDTLLLKRIKKLGFVKTKIDSSKFKLLDEIFCERKHENVEYTSCGAVFRDILIFRKQNKIVGTAKICFECGDNVITGTDRNTKEFGQSGDYGKLYELLHAKK